MCILGGMDPVYLPTVAMLPSICAVYINNFSFIGRSCIVLFRNSPTRVVRDAVVRVMGKGKRCCAVWVGGPITLGTYISLPFSWLRLLDNLLHFRRISVFYALSIGMDHICRDLPSALLFRCRVCSLLLLVTRSFHE